MHFSEFKSRGSFENQMQTPRHSELSSVNCRKGENIRVKVEVHSGIRNKCNGNSKFFKAEKGFGYLQDQ